MSKKTEENNQKNDQRPDWQGAKESLQTLAQKPKESLEKFLHDNYRLVGYLKAQGYSDQDICALLKEKNIPGSYLRNFREVFNRVQTDMGKPSQPEIAASELSSQELQSANPEESEDEEGDEPNLSSPQEEVQDSADSDETADADEPLPLFPEGLQNSDDSDSDAEFN